MGDDEGKFKDVMRWAMEQAKNDREVKRILDKMEKEKIPPAVMLLELVSGQNLSMYGIEFVATMTPNVTGETPQTNMRLGKIPFGAIPSAIWCARDALDRYDQDLVYPDGCKEYQLKFSAEMGEDIIEKEGYLLWSDPSDDNCDG
jgi:hypothetical protein